jgi:hypothetical protein
MEILKNFINSLNFLQIISLALYVATNIWFIKLIFNIYIDLEGFKLAFFLMAIAIFGFSLDFSNGKLNIVSAVTMLAIMLLISLVSVAALAIHLKIKKKEIENDEVK